MRLTDEQLRELQRRNGASLLAYIARRIDPPQDAAAVFNEVLEVVWRRSADVPGDSEQARMWMFGIAARLTANHRRSASRRHALTARLADELAAHPEPAPTEEILAVRAAIERLPAHERELVRLVHWDGFALVEAAQILGIPASTARGRYQTARRRLAADLLPEPVANGSAHGIA